MALTAYRAVTLVWFPIQIILLALMIACGSTGIYSSSVLNDRSQSLESLLNRTEPRAEAAEVLYSSLSVADAAANSAFISGGRESPELRQRYADAIATASTALPLDCNTDAPARAASGSSASAMRAFWASLTALAV